MLIGEGFQTWAPIALFEWFAIWSSGYLAFQRRSLEWLPVVVLPVFVLVGLVFGGLQGMAIFG